MLVFVSKPLWNEPIRKMIPESVSESYDSIKEFTIKIFDENFHLDYMRDQDLSPNLSEPDTPEEKFVEKPELLTPIEQMFSIGNIEIGDTKEKVTAFYGEAVRQSVNEYGLAWLTYHENYRNFIMVAYDEEEIVRGLFTNQDLLSSQIDIAMDSSAASVNAVLGEPEELIHYDSFSYQINSEGEYGVYQIDGNYLTLFYDIHQENQITAVQLIDKHLEEAKDELYPSGSDALQSGFEDQLFDLTNASRVKHGLSILEWEEAVRETARKHSTDMAINQFFSHTNLRDETFSDRMMNDDIRFTLAGENLAYGQFSSIFAHQGLLNSLGHRENILHSDFTKLGIGVDFNESNHPYYTEMFFAD